MTEMARRLRAGTSAIELTIRRKIPKRVSKCDNCELRYIHLERTWGCDSLAPLDPPVFLDQKATVRRSNRNIAMMFRVGLYWQVYRQCNCSSWSTGERGEFYPETFYHSRADKQS
jgi:hypothetical protein